MKSPPAVIFVALLAVVIQGPAEAEPLPKKEYRGLVKRAGKAAKAGAWEQAGEAMRGLAKDDSARAVDDLCKLVTKYGHAEVYRAGLQGLRGMESEEALGRLIEKTKKGKLATRMLAVDACGRREDPKTAEALVAVLDDGDAALQRAAISGIKRRKLLTAMDALIAKLGELEESNPDGLNTAVVREALEALTGEEKARAEDWASFWKENKDGFRPRTGQDRPVEAGGTQTRPTFFGTELVSDRLVFVVDLSSSMEAEDPILDEDGWKRRPTTGGDEAAAKAKAKRSDSRVRIDRAKFQLKYAIDALPSRAKFTIVAYSGYIEDHTGEGGGYRLSEDVKLGKKGQLPEVIGGVRWLQVWKPRLQGASAGNKKSALAFTAALDPGGSTFTLRALEFALSIPDADNIVLLTDGAPTEIRGSVSDALLTSRQILDAVASKNRLRRMRIDTFGVGVEDEESFGHFLRNLASENNGSFTEVR